MTGGGTLFWTAQDLSGGNVMDTAKLTAIGWPPGGMDVLMGFVQASFAK